MIRINGPNEPRKVSPTKKTASAAHTSFAPQTENAAGAGQAVKTNAINHAEMLSALIALQGDGRGRAKTIVAAQRTLDLLDGLRMRLLDGEADAQDLAALEAAAQLRAHADSPSELLDIYDQIALRARVELAKRGR